MDRVSYTGESFLTGSAIAHALLDYSQALAHANDAATVTIPTVHHDGTPGVAQVLVGPASQLITTRVDLDLPEPEDIDLVDHLLATAAHLRGETSSTAGPPVDVPDDDDQYYSDYGI